MALVLNLIVPGSGLVLLRKEWFGLSLSLLFAVCANIAIAGFWIAPDAVPVAVSIAAGVMAAGVWVFSQVACARQRGHLARAEVRIRELIREAESALARRDAKAAHDALASALALNVEHADVHTLRNRITADLAEETSAS